MGSQYDHMREVVDVSRLNLSIPCFGERLRVRGNIVTVSPDVTPWHQMFAKEYVYAELDNLSDALMVALEILMRRAEKALGDIAWAGTSEKYEVLEAEAPAWLVLDRTTLGTMTNGQPWGSRHRGFVISRTTVGHIVMREPGRLTVFGPEGFFHALVWGVMQLFDVRVSVREGGEE